MHARGSILRRLAFPCMFVAFLAFPAGSVAAEPLVVGVLHSEAFPFAAMMRNSLEMAATEINDAGGVDGRPLQLAYADDRGTREDGKQAVRELVRERGAVVLIGAYHSSNAMEMAWEADRLGVPLVVCTAADDRITQRGRRNVYRMNPPASAYTRRLEDFLIANVEPATMSLVFENSPYGTGGAMRMMWFCREHDISIRASAPYHKERQRDEYFAKVVAPLKEDPPDVVFMVSYVKDAVALVTAIADLGLPSLLCGGAGGFTHDDFIGLSGAAAEHVLTATLWHQDLPYPGARDYYDRYLERYAIAPDYHGVEAYSVLLVVADALRRAASLGATDLRAALDATDTMTPFGPVKFVAHGKYERQNLLPTQVLQIIDGRFECIWPRELATATFVLPAGRTRNTGRE